MNERIKLLAEQCKEYVDESSFITYGPIWWEFYNEKFAELIIKECASICEINGNTYMYSFTPAKARLAESTSKYCGTMIKKHFGVEE
jgi:hypothetical protein